MTQTQTRERQERDRQIRQSRLDHGTLYVSTQPIDVLIQVRREHPHLTGMGELIEVGSRLIAQVVS